MALNQQGEKEKEIISLEECKQYLGEFDLNDQRIYDIRNTLIGLASKSIDSYLENFV